MASTDILSQTLSAITSIKLEELSDQRSRFEDGKAQLLKVITANPDQGWKVRTLLNGIKHLPAMGKLNDNPTLSLTNIKQFMEQARHDPSVSDRLQKGWQEEIEKELDVHSLKYAYASLYGKLVNEWLSASENGSSVEGSAFEEIGRKEMYEQRRTWEEYVFKGFETDSAAIHNYLRDLFKSSKANAKALKTLKEETKDFEETMAETKHFDKTSLKWVIEGLLLSDLVTDEKRKVLKDFLNNRIVLAEVADVLNMRMKSLDKWKWDAEGSSVEQRRHLNGRYRFYHDEDLLQSLLLRYIGVKWSIHFQGALTNFQQTSGVWKSSSAPVPVVDQKRRDYFLGTGRGASSLGHPPQVFSYRGRGGTARGGITRSGSTRGFGNSVEDQRAEHYNDEIFLEQLQGHIDEPRGGYDNDQPLEPNSGKSPQQITQTLLHVLAAEIIMKTRLGHDVTVVRSDFRWFGPSLPHKTMFEVLLFFGVSERWIDFFRRALEAPIKFVNDGPDAPIQVRKRGTPISGPLSDMLGEAVLFCLDFAMNQRADGARLYRLHDDIWFWGSADSCVKGWAVMTEFAELMGPEFNSEKTGSVMITRDDKRPSQLPASLPKGDVRWGFLKLDSATGRFLIDRNDVDKHIEELRRQLEACKSTFDWIRAWNVYGARFFTANFGTPANSFARDHVDMLLEVFSYIQTKLFASTGGSVTSTLKNRITERFGVEDIPEGYLYFPMSMGGLDLQSPFVNLYLVRDKIDGDRDYSMRRFFSKEEAEYASAKALFEKGDVPGRSSLSYELKGKFDGEPFMSFEEFARHREHTSEALRDAYVDMTSEPSKKEVKRTSDVSSVLDDRAWKALTPYQRWIIQLYAPDMIARFGGLNVVEKGLLPTGMVSMFRESRFKWQG